MNHSKVSVLLFVGVVIVFAYWIGFGADDTHKLLDKVLNVCGYLAFVSFFSLLYNGYKYNTWELFSEDISASSSVFSAIILGIAIIIAFS